jgi:hypothetical protein
MRTRTFIGLAFLIVALIVASNPVLLDSTARGVEVAGLQVGLLHGSSNGTPTYKSSKKQAASALALKGYQLDKSGNLVDTVPLDKRGAVGSTRLLGGSTRVLLPGQLEGTGTDAPPYPATGKLLLDVTGCPVFRAGTDVAALLADPATKLAYTNAVNASTNPKACSTFINGLVTANTPSTLAPATSRELASMSRGGYADLIIGLREMDMLNAMLSMKAASAQLAKLQG